MHIYIASDHRGVKLKHFLVKHFSNYKHPLTELGHSIESENDDYPDIVQILQEKINKNSMGILICGSGIGVTISANRFPNIRCGLCMSAEQARVARHDDNINVLSLASNFISEKQAISIVNTFIQTPFGREKRYRQRLQKINNYANDNCCSSCACKHKV